MSTERSKCAAVVRNPFSTATAAPKLMDHKALRSLGMRRNLVKSYDFGAENDYDIILSPILDSPMYIRSAANTAAGDVTAKAGGDIPVFGTDVNLMSWKKMDPAVEPKTDVGQDTKTEVSKWRMVSQGMKITLVNSADDNDGWFEAFPFTPNFGFPAIRHTTTRAGIDALTKDTPVGMSAFPPGEYGLNDKTELNGWSAADKQGYITGKLRNINKYIFANKRNNRDHEFVEVPTAAIYEQIPTFLADKNMTCWYIRIHGRKEPATASDCCKATKLMVHVAQNIEYIPGEQNVLNRYATKAPSTGTRSYKKRRTTYPRRRRYVRKAKRMNGRRY